MSSSGDSVSASASESASASSEASSPSPPPVVKTRPKTKAKPARPKMTPPTAPPPTYESLVSTDARNRLDDMVQSLEIQIHTRREIETLAAYHNVMLLDDSGSMQEILQDEDHPNYGLSRWDDLKQTMRPILDILLCLGEVDIHFLNRKGQLGVQTVAQFDALVVAPPKGFTPLSDKMQSIIADHRSLARADERKLHIFIATDGEPHSGGYGPPDDTNRFYNAVQNKGSDVFVSFMCFTDNEDDKLYLDRIDVNIPGTDVTDDRVTETREVMTNARAYGITRFTLGDYIAKSLLGSTMGKWKDIDLKFRKQQLNRRRGGDGGGDDACCIIL